MPGVMLGLGCTAPPPPSRRATARLSLAARYLPRSEAKNKVRLPVPPAPSQRCCTPHTNERLVNDVFCSSAYRSEPLVACPGATLLARLMVQVAHPRPQRLEEAAAARQAQQTLLLLLSLLLCGRHAGIPGAGMDTLLLLCYLLLLLSHRLPMQLVMIAVGMVLPLVLPICQRICLLPHPCRRPRLVHVSAAHGRQGGQVGGLPQARLVALCRLGLAWWVPLPLLEWGHLGLPGVVPLRLWDLGYTRRRRALPPLLLHLHPSQLLLSGQLRCGLSMLLPHLFPLTLHRPGASLLLGQRLLLLLLPLRRCPGARLLLPQLVVLSLQLLQLPLHAAQPERA